MSTIFHKFYPISAPPTLFMSFSTPFQIYDSPVIINVTHTLTHTHSLLTPFRVAYMYLCLELTAWVWTTFQDLLPGER